MKTIIVVLILIAAGGLAVANYAQHKMDLVDPTLQHSANRAVDLSDMFLLKATELRHKNFINNDQYANITYQLTLAKQAAIKAAAEDSEQLYQAAKHILVEIEEELRYYIRNSGRI